MSKESQDFRDQAAAEYRAFRQNSMFGTRPREILRARAKAFKALSSNEEWLNGEMDRIISAPYVRRQAIAQK
jgi:hypothetical protein